MSSINIKKKKEYETFISKREREHLDQLHSSIKLFRRKSYWLTLFTTAFSVLLVFRIVLVSEGTISSDKLLLYSINPFLLLTLIVITFWGSITLSMKAEKIKQDITAFLVDCERRKL